MAAPSGFTHHPYDKPLSVYPEYLEALRLHQFEGPWVATEKVDGALFFFTADGETVRCGTKYLLLDENSLFYDFGQILAKYREKVLGLFNSLSAKTLTIYGELFGGWYPGALGVSPIQKRIFYSPQHEFYAFDVLLDNAAYLDYEEIAKLLAEFGFFYAKPSSY